MPQKERLPLEEKVKIVEGYLNGEIGCSSIQTEYGISCTTVFNWVRLYKARGIEGLIPATRTRKYLPETKRLAVEDYLSGVGSQNDICVKYDISDRRLLRNWIKCYNSHGDFKTSKHRRCNLHDKRS